MALRQEPAPVVHFKELLHSRPTHRYLPEAHAQFHLQYVAKGEGAGVMNLQTYAT